jgi:hypothetical protein
MSISYDRMKDCNMNTRVADSSPLMFKAANVSVSIMVVGTGLTKGEVRFCISWVEGPYSACVSDH